MVEEMEAIAKVGERWGGGGDYFWVWCFWGEILVESLCTESGAVP